MTKIAGLDTYMAHPDQFTGRAVLFISDAFGLPFVNSRLLADTYAKQAGVLVVLPDFFEGDPVPESALKTGQFDFMSWIAKHGKDHCYPLIENVARELREKHGVTKLAAIGFCWGGWATLKLGATDLVDAVAVAHPSMVDMPADIENLKKPALFLCAEIDQQFPEEKRKAAQEILQKKGFDATFEFYPGTTHGFAVRFNSEDQVAAKAAEDAKDKAVTFFKKYLA
jgi:dienelactone hydrolase